MHVVQRVLQRDGKDVNCKICGTQNISPSMGGADICGWCDCYPANESKLRQENERLKREIDQLRLKHEPEFAKEYLSKKFCEL